MVDRIPVNSENGIRVPMKLVTQVRDLIQDYSQVNELFEGTELTDSQIAKFIVDTVDDWNYTPPPLTLVSPTDLVAVPTNGAIRVVVLKGAAVKCLRILILRHAKNDMPFTAGNVTIQAHSIWKNLLALVDGMNAEYETTKLRVKVSLNVQGAYSMAPSELDYYYGYGYNDGAFILV